MLLKKYLEYQAVWKRDSGSPGERGGGSRKQVQVREDPDNHRRLFDGGDEPELPVIPRAVFEVNMERALEQARGLNHHAVLPILRQTPLYCSTLTPDFLTTGLHRSICFCTKLRYSAGLLAMTS